MKLASEVSPEKLRGGYYTPAPLVHFCLSRVEELATASELRVLEPSAGDGAFLRGLDRASTLKPRIGSVLGIEVSEEEAAKSRAGLQTSGIPGEVIDASVIEWAISSNESFDAAVGNPPFVRYQFLSELDKLQIAELGEQTQIKFTGVSNLWIPVLVAALSTLKVGGAFSFVVPSELLTGSSAARLREWLATSFDELRIDMFEPGLFPDVLQDVIVLSGIRHVGVARQRSIRFEQRRSLDDIASVWSHDLSDDHSSWTRYLLTGHQLEALESTLQMPCVNQVGELARFQVSTVTGANGFFTVTDPEMERFDLFPWAVPLLSRSKGSRGLVHSGTDQSLHRKSGLKSWLLDFSEASPDPRASELPDSYLAYGQAQGLHRRYKCRIREPWYRVPVISPGELLLSKRSHRIPRVLVNEAGVHTTDTIYKGQILPEASLSPESFAASFHNSLTMLSAELLGRSFGGGVLELVPSEVSRLAVFKFAGSNCWIGELDHISRIDGEEMLVEATNRKLVGEGLITQETMAILEEARWELQQRRLDRNTKARRAAEAVTLEHAA